MAGVFLLLALAAGILRMSGTEATSPIIKSIVDRAPDGLLVTDAGGRVVYANAAYLELTGTSSSDDTRPIERVFVGDPGVSEAVYRLLRAAREGRHLREEVRVGGRKGEAGRGARTRGRPRGRGKPPAGVT